MTPTDEQSAILDLVASTKSNIIINALAGTGKSSTLRMIERACNIRPCLYLVFNKRNADEAKFDEDASPVEAAGRMLPTTVVQTLNACGHRVWAKVVSRNLTVTADKIPKLLRQLIDELKPRSLQKEAWNVYWQVIHAVALAKAYGYIPDGAYDGARRLCTREVFHETLDETPDDLVADLIDATLIASIKLGYAGALDFNDQLYLPALFGGTFPRFPLIMVDEKQDLNPVNHAMLDKLATGRIIGVGDPWQSIYAFRGAMQGGMAYAQERFKMTPADLSVSFRCPQAIVEAARWRVPNFKWIKPGGLVVQLTDLSAHGIPDGAVFLCRNNAPLFRLGIAMLSHGRGVNISGSDIGPKLVGIMRKLGAESMTKAQTIDAIEHWRAERLAKESKTANDLADCMLVFAEQAQTLSGAIATAEHVIKQKGSIRMMTGHKAKGLEFDCVYHLDPWLCRDDEQDLNLRYVITTRSKDKLYEIDSARIKWA